MQCLFNLIFSEKDVVPETNATNNAVEVLRKPDNIHISLSIRLHIPASVLMLLCSNTAMQQLNAKKFACRTQMLMPFSSSGGTDEISFSDSQFAQ